MKINISVSAVPLYMLRPYMSLFNRRRYNYIFNRYGTGKKDDKYRIYLPLNSPNFAQHPNMAPAPIADFLTSRGFTLVDYIAGIVKMGKRVFRLGKVLNDDPRLKQVFDNDSQRNGYKTAPAFVVISRHPYDIVGMSFDRGWTSCMHPHEGSEYLKAAIKQGVLVAYLIKNDDLNINNPTARISLVPRYNGTYLILTQTPMLGTADARFQAVVDAFLKRINIGAPPGVYTIAPGLYDDINMSKYAYHYNHMDDLKEASFPELEILAGTFGLTERVCDFLINQHHLEISKRLAMNTYIPEQVALKLAKSVSPVVRSTLASWTKWISVLKYLSDAYPDVRTLRGIVRNPIVPEDMLHSFLALGDPILIRDIASHRNVSSTDLTHLMDTDPDIKLRTAIARNKRTPVHMLQTLATDESPEVSAQAKATLNKVQVTT